EVDDVLVALGRILGSLDGAVGSPLEPLRVLADVRMVGRALEGDVERHLHAEVLRGSHEPAEIVDRSELGVDPLVSPFRAADGPRTADVVWRRGQRVVLSLARGPADG